MNHDYITFVQFIEANDIYATLVGCESVIMDGTIGIYTRILNEDGTSQMIDMIAFPY